MQTMIVPSDSNTRFSNVAGDFSFATKTPLRTTTLSKLLENPVILIAAFTLNQIFEINEPIRNNISINQIH